MDAAERRELIEKYRAAYDVFAARVSSLSAAELDRNDPEGGWTPREVVHHMADSEMIAAIRLRSLIAGEQLEIKGHSEEEYARRLHYAGRPIAGPLALLKATRAASLELLETLTEAEWQISQTNEQTGRTMTPEFWLQVYANHPHNHLAQIEDVLSNN
jgi:hypothetical protein